MEELDVVTAVDVATAVVVAAIVVVDGGVAAGVVAATVVDAGHEKQQPPVQHNPREQSLVELQNVQITLLKLES